jgi:outer membrane protein OmpA-like peptidoglycan-associated protein
MNLYGNIGFLLSGWKEGDPNPLFDNYQNSLLYGVGIELPMTSSKIRLFSEFTFVHEFGDDEDNQIITFTPRSTPLEDVVNDTGQASIGVNINLIGNVLLSGGAAFQILGEEAVPDGPDWRGFVNLSYVFGRRTATPSTDVKIFTDSAEETQISPPIKETPITNPAEKTPNRCPEITDVSLSDSVVNGGEQVRVTITAHDPDGDQLLYFWIASRGVLTGSETQITWTVSECSEFDATTGTHDLSVEVSDGECTVNRPIKILVNCTPPKRRPEVVLPESIILFPQGSTKLDNIAKAQLDNIAALLRQFPDQTIRLEGHTDATGKEETNTRIGLKRAESVKQYLVKRHGIDPNRITTISYGSTRPAAPNDTKAGRAKNRRVEIYQRF